MRARLFLLIIVVIISSLVSCGWNSKPKYPTPPVYPNAMNIMNKEELGGLIRITSFQTTDTPEEVQSFYDAILIEHGWEFDGKFPNGVSYKYLNGVENPAFGLEIIAVIDQNNQTVVTVRQNISGPFTWD